MKDVEGRVAVITGGGSDYLLDIVPVFVDAHVHATL